MSGKNIKKLRMEYEISVQRLAAYMRIEQEELLDWEAGIRVPDEEQLERLAQLFQVDSSELIDAKERSVMKKQRESKSSDQKNKKQEGEEKAKPEKRPSGRQSIEPIIKQRSKPLSKNEGHGRWLWSCCCLWLVWRLEADSFTGNTEMSSFHRSRNTVWRIWQVPLRTKMLITVLHLQLYSGAMVPLFSHKTAVRECRM